MIPHQAIRETAALIALGILAMLALAAMSAAIIWRAQDQRKLDEIATSTNQALCAFKADLERRERATAVFLSEHPRGIPGISRGDLLLSLESQQATLKALDDLDC